MLGWHADGLGVPLPSAPLSASRAGRTVVLALPFEARGLASAIGATSVSGTGYILRLPSGGSLPPHLAPYGSEPFSWERWREAELNAVPAAALPGYLADIRDGATTTVFKPRPHQIAGAKAALSARQAGLPGFLLADAVGLGKTITAALALRAMPDTGLVVILCPLSVVAHWRRTVLGLGHGGRRFLILNYDRVKRLFEPPASVAKAKKAKTKNKQIVGRGRLLLQPDAVILDESHRCFPYATIVDTEIGPLPIGEVVEGQLPVRVWARNDTTGIPELRQITSWMRSPAEEPLVRLMHERGEITATASHPILSAGDGYLPALEILRRVDAGKRMCLVWRRDAAREAQGREVVRQELPRPKPERPEAQDGDLELSRVVGGALLERGSAHVYNLEVDELHNYFAGGVLVHNCRNPASQTSTAVRRLTAAAKFTIYASATAGQNPLELSYMARLLAATTGTRLGEVGELDDWAGWCTAQGLGISRGAYGKWMYERSPGVEAKIRRMLFESAPGRASAGLRRRPTDLQGWPALDANVVPVSLDPAQRSLYLAAWTEYRARMRLAGRGRDSNSRLVQLLRFRQKCSLLRLGQTADLVEDRLAAGNQVVISVVFGETAQALVDKLGGREKVALVTGSVTGAAREAERVRFQTGEVKVVVCSVTEGISLHAGELGLPGGRVASTAQRVTIVSDPRWTALELEQISGRAHRDGQYSEMILLVGEGTVELEVTQAALERWKSMRGMQGDPDADLSRAQSILDRAAGRDPLPEEDLQRLVGSPRQAASR